MGGNIPGENFLGGNFLGEGKLLFWMLMLFLMFFPKFFWTLQATLVISSEYLLKLSVLSTLTNNSFSHELFSSLMFFILRNVWFSRFPIRWHLSFIVFIWLSKNDKNSCARVLTQLFNHTIFITLRNNRRFLNISKAILVYYIT